MNTISDGIWDIRNKILFDYFRKMSEYDYSLIADEDTRQYLELKEKYNRLEKEYKNLQVEHSRLLFDMDAVIENEVKIRCKSYKKKTFTWNKNV